MNNKHTRILPSPLMMRSLLILSVLLILPACSTEKRLYKTSCKLNTIEGYEEYLSEFEHGKYADKAEQNIQNLRFYSMRDSAFSSFTRKLEDPPEYNQNIISIKPSAKVLMGTPVSIELNNLPPNKPVTLHAYRYRWGGLIYSFATYLSDPEGRVLLNKSEAIRGTYSGTDSLGVFWSMTWLSKEGAGLPLSGEDENPNHIHLSVEADNVLIAKETLVLLEQLPRVVTDSIRNDTLTAIVHYPEGGTNLPLLLLVGGGSSGELDFSNTCARVIASHGYASMVLAYEKVDRLPDYLERIPLEYFLDAIDWIKEKPLVDSERIIIAGGSRGGELVLLLASLDPDIKGVIAIEPSYLVWQGLPHDPGSVFFPKAAWTLEGRDLPFVKHKFDFHTMIQFGSGASQIDLMKLHAPRLDEIAKHQAALIRVENINGPIFLIAGKSGQVWPSYKMCMMMEDRLDSLQFNHPVECRYYEDAGHNVVALDLPPTINYKYEGIQVGGTDPGNAAAQVNSWTRIIGFLNEYFPVEQ